MNMPVHLQKLKEILDITLSIADLHAQKHQKILG